MGLRKWGSQLHVAGKVHHNVRSLLQVLTELTKQGKRQQAGGLARGPGPGLCSMQSLCVQVVPLVTWEDWAHRAVPVLRMLRDAKEELPSSPPWRTHDLGVLMPYV